MGSNFIPCKDPDPIRPSCYCRCHDNGDDFVGICDHRCCTSAQQPDGGAEDAFDKWIHEDHFGVGCEIGMNDTAHSEECVEAAFKDGYVAGKRAPIPPASPEREAVYRAVDAVIDFTIHTDAGVAGYGEIYADYRHALNRAIEAAARKESRNDRSR